MMDLTGLHCLIATIRAGSFSGAARQLGIPKSTVASRVDGLEARFGTRLLERTTRQVRPTAEGSMLFERGERLLMEAWELEQLFREQGSVPRGTLRVSVPVLFEQEFMGRIAAIYVTRHPQADIEVVPDDRRVDLVAEGFDCAVRAGNLQDSSAIARPFAQTRNVVVACRSLVERLGEPRTVNDLSHWPALWIGRDIAGSKNWEVEKNGRTVLVKVEPRAFLGSLHAARAAVLNGSGAALLPNFLVRDDLRTGRLICISSRWQPPSVPLSIVYPAHKQPSPRLRAFIDIVLEEFKSRDLDEQAT